MIKNLIKQRFTKSLETYSNSAVIQKHMAEKLTVMLKKKCYDNILELGCGTGFVTENIVKNINFNTYDAMDLVSGCAKFISSISEKINFYNADFEKYIPDRKYDLIISNAAMQWLDDFIKFVYRITKYLNKNGTFAFTVFGSKNFEELKFITGLKYYSMSELKNILRDFEIEEISEEKIVLNFNTPKEALMHIKKTGANAIIQKHWTKTDLRNFEIEYSKICKDKIKLTYNPIYVVLNSFMEFNYKENRHF